jgi:hypothetical protein
VGLVTGDAQTDAGGAVHHPEVDSAGTHSELMFD